MQRAAPPGRRSAAANRQNSNSSSRTSSPAPYSVTNSNLNPTFKEGESEEFNSNSNSLSSPVLKPSALSNSHRANVQVSTEIPREEIEKALEGLSRDDLVMALGRAKVQMDQVSTVASRWDDRRAIDRGESQQLSHLGLE